MQYLCLKQLTAANVTYFAGDTIPDGVILPERSAKLINSGYISELDEAVLQEDTAMMPKDGIPVDGEVFTQKQVEQMLAEAVEDAVNNTIVEMEKKQAELQTYTAELQAIPPEALGNKVLISVHIEGSGENGQMMALPVEPQEIQQVFSVMQLNAEDGVKAIAGIDSENVLILLHAADNRITIKNAARKQADKLFPADGAKNEPGNGNGATGTHTEGDDT
ncbi:MAG: hypothetical protein K2N87_18530 [Eubacterium sp.]|nr:hypothetical protein [Eubacterium sp.]